MHNRVLRWKCLYIDNRRFKLKNQNYNVKIILQFNCNEQLKQVKKMYIKKKNIYKNYNFDFI